MNETATNNGDNSPQHETETENTSIKEQKAELENTPSESAKPPQAAILHRVRSRSNRYASAVFRYKRNGTSASKI